MPRPVPLLPFVRSGLLFGLLSGLLLGGLLFSYAEAAATPELLVAQGKLRGKDVYGVQEFLGVPYATPPLGRLRWRAPEAAQGWTGTRDATTFGPACVQGQGKAATGKEDCLTLNIYRPPGSTAHSRLPVMVWVHGGFFTGGDSSLFSGEALARDFGVVVVTVNYRLGLLGFLAAPGVGDGNYGLMDIQESLRWVRQNAQAFGGNPQNVTLFGNSAGSAAICTLLTAPSSAAPSSAGLFQKAILQSGSCVSPVMISSLAQARQNGAGFLKHFACGKTELVGDCLRRQPLSALTRYPLPSRSLIDPVPLPPVYGDTLVPNWPQDAFVRGNFLKIPVLLGQNAQEGRIFEPYLPRLAQESKLMYLAALRVLDYHNAAAIARNYPATRYETPVRALSSLLTDRIFACPNIWLTRQFARQVPTYLYEFSDPDALYQQSANTDGVTLGPYHGSEIPYVLSEGVDGVANPTYWTPAQRKLAHQMGEYWTNFAKSGQPAALGLSAWPTASYTLPSALALAPGASEVRGQLDAQHQCDFWDGLDSRISLW